MNINFIPQSKALIVNFPSWIFPTDVLKMWYITVLKLSAANNWRSNMQTSHHHDTVDAHLLFPAWTVTFRSYHTCLYLCSANLQSSFFMYQTPHKCSSRYLRVQLTLHAANKSLLSCRLIFSCIFYQHESSIILPQAYLPHCWAQDRGRTKRKENFNKWKFQYESGTCTEMWNHQSYITCPDQHRLCKRCCLLTARQEIHKEGKNCSGKGCYDQHKLRLFHYLRYKLWWLGLLLSISVYIHIIWMRDILGALICTAKQLSTGQNLVRHLRRDFPL